MFLDNNNRIEREIRDNLTDTSYIYSNNNLVQIIQKINNNIITELKFNYLNKEISEFYTYEKYLFGTEWKNNLALDTQSGYIISSNAHKFSNNYVSDYKFTLYQTPEDYIVTGTFEYEFDSDGDIIKQTENINHSNGSTSTYVITFIYN